MAVAGSAFMACTVAAVMLSPRGQYGSRAELLMGGGFLGDLPHGGENGHAMVRDMKAMVHSQAQAAKMQASLASSIMGGGTGGSSKARAAALRAAAEIAKVLDVPSARDIVEGHARAHHAAVKPVESDVDTTGLASDSKKDKNPTPWLKTPKEYDEFKYSRTQKAQLKPVLQHCDHLDPSECNDEDTASQAHGWADTPDRSAMGVHSYESE